MPDRALMLVDLQYDFMPGGALSVAGGDEVVPIANALMPRFRVVVATQDWHPYDHHSFVTAHPDKEVGDIVELDGLEQIVWPVHCVQGSDGAKFHENLETQRVSDVFPKGTSRKVDSYSAFFDNARRNDTGLGDYLRQRGIQKLYVMGLATDYCVLASVLDALDLGFDVFVVEEGCRAVDMQEGDGEAALKAMKKAGAKRIGMDEVG